MTPKLEPRIEFDYEGPSVMVPFVGYAAVRVLAKLLTQLAPMSAFTALLTTLFWLAAAIYVFGVVTWKRDDNWLGGGIIVASTLFVGGALAEIVGHVVQPGAFGEALVSTGSALVALFIRSLVLAPLSGLFVFGARWLTEELRSSDVLS